MLVFLWREKNLRTRRKTLVRYRRGFDSNRGTLMDSEGSHRHALPDPLTRKTFSVFVVSRWQFLSLKLTVENESSSAVNTAIPLLADSLNTAKAKWVGPASLVFHTRVKQLNFMAVWELGRRESPGTCRLACLCLFAWSQLANINDCCECQ